MLFTAPIDFAEALESREVKVLLPTTLSSKGLEAIRPEIRERSKFSARVTNAGFIEEFDSLTRQILSPRRVQREDGTEATEGMDYATARLRMKEYLDRTNYTAAPGEEGTIQDLRSDKRLNLILETNTQMAQGYGGWKQGQEEGVLDVWPAQELYRAEEREEKRDWIVRWLNAAGQVDDAKAGSALRKFGRMIARKDSAVWVNLGPFQLPYAPFDFGSGMDVRDVERAAAVEVGVVETDTVVKVQDRGFNDALQAALPVRTEAMRRAVLEDLGPGYAFEGETLKKISGGNEPEMTTPPIGAATARREPRPAGRRVAQRPVSAALQVIRRKPSSLEETKTIIDQVHDDGELPRIQVDGDVPSSAVGVYRSSRSGKALGVGVQYRAGDEFTFLHEIGHFLDHQALGVQGAFASKDNPLLGEWRSAVRTSEAYRALKEAARDPAKKRIYGKHLEYLKSSVELWARSYAQWMAGQILQRNLGTPELRERLTEEMERRRKGLFGSGHWSDADFAPIGAAIEKLFEKKGWNL